MCSSDLTFVLKPHVEDTAEHQLDAEDLSLSFYSGDEVDLAPLLREAMILALPTRPLCSEDCQGLCPHCGGNRNQGACSCHATEAKPPPK